VRDPSIPRVSLARFTDHGELVRFWRRENLCRRLGDRVGAGDIECEWNDTVIVPGSGCPRGGVDLGRPAFDGLPDEFGAEASVGTGDEDDPAGYRAGHRVITILPLALPCST
jgi:hypothetical protein